MKFKRALGGVLLFVGCIAVLAGVAAVLLPMVDNAQLQRVLASFLTRDDRPVIDIMNRCLAACLRYSYVVAGVGLGLLLLGGLLRIGTGAQSSQQTSDEDSTEPSATLRKTAAPSRAPISGAPREHHDAYVDSYGDQGRTSAECKTPIAAIAPPPTTAVAQSKPALVVPHTERIAPPTVKRCPACGADNTAFASFCRRCGTDLPVEGQSVCDKPADSPAPAIEPIEQESEQRSRRTLRSPAPVYEPPMRVVAEPKEDAPEPPAPTKQDAVDQPNVDPEPDTAPTFRQPLVGGRPIRLENIARAPEAPVVVSGDEAPVPPGTPTVYVSINAPYPSPLVNVSSTPPARELPPMPALESPRGFVADAPAARAESVRYEPNEPAAAAPVRLSARITSTVGVRMSDEA